MKTCSVRLKENQSQKKGVITAEWSKKRKKKTKSRMKGVRKRKKIRNKLVLA